MYIFAYLWVALCISIDNNGILITLCKLYFDRYTSILHCST